MTIHVFVDKTTKEYVSFDHEIFSTPRELVEHVIESLWNNVKILLVCRGAWRLWRQVKERAWKAGLNWLLVEAVDPLEAKFAGVSFEALVKARYYSLAESNADHAIYRCNPEKLVDRRTLFHAGPATLLEYVDSPVVNSELCNVARGCRDCIKACPRGALEGKPPRVNAAKCGGCGYCVTICPVSALEQPSTPKRGLWRQVLLYTQAGVAILVFACRDSIAELLDYLEPNTRVGIVPVGTPTGVGLDILLSAWGLGARPLLYCTSVPGDALQAYKNTVDQDYKTATGERLRIVLNIEQLLGALKSMSKPSKKIIEPVKNTRRAALQTLAAMGKKVNLSTPLIGLVSIDANNCTLCGVCVASCPARALSLEEQGALWKLTFRHESCILCRACVKACPETAITVQNIFSPDHYGKTVVLVEEEMARCKVCGKLLGPKKMVEKVAQRLRECNMPEPIIERVYMCDECKFKAALDIIGRIGKTSTEQKS